MIKAKLSASFITGAIALSLGLMGCASNTANSNASSRAEPASTTREASPTNSPATVEATSSSINDVYTGTHYWEGTLDSGAAFFWMNDEATKNAQIIVFHSQDGEVPSLAFSGPVNTSTDKTNVMITNTATAQTLSFKITDCPNPNSISIDAGEHGTGALAAISPEQFQSDTEPILTQINTRAEEAAKSEETTEGAEAQEGEGETSAEGAEAQEGDGAVEEVVEEVEPVEGEYVEIESEEVI